MSDSTQALPSRFPDAPALAGVVAHVLRGIAPVAGHVTILNREPNVYESTFPSEVVTCQLGDGSRLRLLCKYGANSSHLGHCRRGGVAYEAEVYRRLLQSLQSSTPRLYGVDTDPTSHAVCLVIEYLDDSERLHRTLEPEAAILEAARWLGRFHALCQDRLSCDLMPFLNAWDAEFYLGWVRRTSSFARYSHTRFPWLQPLCDRSVEFIEPLVSAAATVLHGEYSAKNILLREGLVYPVDWECAAVGAGEIDLASLTDRWPSEIARECEIEYRHERWTLDGSAEFERTLAAARLYLQFRWLGDRPEWTGHEDELWRFEALRLAGEQLALI